MHAIGALPLGFVAGAGTPLEAHLTTVLASTAWATAVMATVGVTGIGIALWRRLSARGWRLAFVAFVVDEIVTSLLVQPLQQTFDPVALWPYALGTISTFAVALWLGWMALRNDDLAALSIAFVSIDLLAVALVSAVSPVPLTAALISRIVVALVAAGAGCIAGSVLKNRADKNVGINWLTIRDALIFPIVATIIGGVATALIIR